MPYAVLRYPLHLLLLFGPRQAEKTVEFALGHSLKTRGKAECDQSSGISGMNPVPALGAARDSVTPGTQVRGGGCLFVIPGLVMVLKGEALGLE